MTSQTASRDTSTITVSFYWEALEMGVFGVIQGFCGSLTWQNLRNVTAKSIVQEAGSILSSLPHSVVQNAKVDLELKSGFARAVVTGGTALLCVAGMTYIANKYGGSAVRRNYFNTKTESKDRCPVNGHHPDAEGLESDSCSSQLFDPKWCLSPGSQWWELAGDAWSRGQGVPNDPLYGIPPWMETSRHEDSEDEGLRWDEEFNLPADALWADICPVVDLVTEPPYRLEEAEEEEEVV